MTCHCTMTFLGMLTCHGTRTCLDTIACRDTMTFHDTMASYDSMSCAGTMTCHGTLACPHTTVARAPSDPRISLDPLCVFLSLAFCSCHSTSCGKGWRPLGNSSRVKVDMGMVARMTGATVVREERARYFLPSLPQAPVSIGSSSAPSASESDGSSLRAASIF